MVDFYKFPNTFFKLQDRIKMNKILMDLSEIFLNLLNSTLIVQNSMSTLRKIKINNNILNS